jgi:hypothetical protein
MWILTTIWCTTHIWQPFLGVKIKLNLYLCLKNIWGGESLVPHILNLGTSMSSVLSFMGWLLCIQRKSLLLHSGRVFQWDLDQCVQNAFFHPVPSIVTVLTVFMFKQWWTTAKRQRLQLHILQDSMYSTPWWWLNNIHSFRWCSILIFNTSVDLQQ